MNRHRSLAAPHPARGYVVLDVRPDHVARSVNTGGILWRPHRSRPVRIVFHPAGFAKRSEKKFLSAGSAVYSPA